MSDHLYDQGIREQIDFVRKLSDSKLLQQTSGGEDVLDVSDSRNPFETHWLTEVKGHQSRSEHRPLYLYPTRQHRCVKEEQQECGYGEGMGKDDHISWYI
jgi:hypothetical protein